MLIRFLTVSLSFLRFSAIYQFGLQPTADRTVKAICFNIEKRPKDLAILLLKYNLAIRN